MAHKNDIEVLFDTLIDRYDDMVRRICATYSTPSIPAEDLYQEAMMAMWRGLSHFRGDAALSTWVYRISINSCISFLRRNNRHQHTVDIETAFNIAVDERRPYDDDTSFLHYLIGRLNPIDKAIILMWLDERSYNEIADVTGLSRSVIGTRLTRIRTKLQRAFETENNQDSTSNNE